MPVEPERNRFYVTIPDNDPRFHALLGALRAAQIPGRNSPVSRMLAEWALLGFALQHGLLHLPGANPPPPVGADGPDPQIIAEQQQAIEESMAEFGFG